MTPDFERCWRAVRSRDTRFDGIVFCAVVTTRVYCRPSCPGAPARRNVRFFASAAAAQGAGFRACKRCRPDAAPGSPDWDVRADVVGRAVRLIADGVVDRDGVAGLARRLGYTPRHLHRQMLAELGVGPQAVARAQRAQTARVLLETSPLPITEVAAAAGFTSIRAFNDTVRAVFDRSPSQVRASARRAGPVCPGALEVRLAVRAPFDGHGVLAQLAADPTPGVEDVDGSRYRRGLRLPRGAATVELRPGAEHVDATLWLDDVRDLTAAIHRCRRLFDLDADPRAITEALGADALIAPLVAARPGLRVGGHADLHELAVRAALRTHLPSPAARRAAAALVRDHGTPLTSPVGDVTHLFPAPATLAGLELDAWPVAALAASPARAVSRALVSGELVLDEGTDRADARARLADLLDDRTAEEILRRGLKDPDAFPDVHPGVHPDVLPGADPRTVAGLRRLGVPAAGAGRVAERWRPWRSYALTHLRWTAGPESTGPVPAEVPGGGTTAGTDREGSCPSGGVLAVSAHSDARPPRALVMSVTREGSPDR